MRRDATFFNHSLPHQVTIGDANYSCLQGRRQQAAVPIWSCALAALADDFVDQSILASGLSIHKVVAIGILADGFQGLASMD